MLPKRFSLLFILKKPKGCKGGKQHIYMRITIGAARVEPSTQKECEPDRWNPHAGRGNGSKEEIRTINDYLDSLKTKVYEALRSLVDRNEPVTVESMKRKLRDTAERPRMVL